jgi:phenylacetate-coenzyme A ligase PaaK-like adenylate-forming protein
MLFPLLASLLPASRKNLEANLVRRVRDAATYVAYYHDLLTANGLKPSDFKSIADCVERFPRTSSQEYRCVMQEHGLSYLIDRRFKDETFNRIRTSGSSGIPCDFIRTKTEFARIHAANTVSTLVAAGVRPWHRIMAMLPPWSIEKEHHPLQRLGIFQRFDASFTEEPDAILQRIMENGVNVLFGRTGMMLALAERALKRGIDLPMEVVLPGAEIITADTRRFLCDVFRPKHYGELYGATETGLIALRRGSDDYQVNYRSVFFALTNPRAVGDVTRGEIAVTSLHAAAAPIIMLELGDIIACRQYHRLLDLKASIVSIEGRVSDYVIGRNGEKIWSSEFYGLLGGASGVRQFRIVQERPGECEILLRGAPHAALSSSLELHFKGRISLQVRWHESIPLGPSGKASVIFRTSPHIDLVASGDPSFPASGLDRNQQ